MKPFKHLHHIALYLLVPAWWLVRRKTTGRLVLFSFLLFMLAGCFQFYYKTNSRHSIDAATIQQLQAANKYFILHFRDSSVALTRLVFNNDTMQANMAGLLPEHAKYLNPDKLTTTTQTTVFSSKKDRYRVRARDRFATLMEVHLYIDEDLRKDQSQVSVPFSSFKRIDVYELDKSATTTNHVLSIVGGTLVVGAAVGLIAFLIACNCPQVCVNDNGSYQFVGGVYSGAVYSSLERTDYLPLNDLRTVNNVYEIKIRNVNDEEQFINRMQLLRVNHSADVNVLADRHGNILSYQSPQLPARAVINKKTDITGQLSGVDNDEYLFDGEKGDKGFSNVVLTFNKPAAAQKGKLIIHGGNSLWSGYLYHSFAELFGSGYGKWRNEKDRSDPKVMEQWQRDQALPLMVYVEKDGHWQFVDYFAHTGNTASRDMIMELDLPSPGTNQVKIKLETVYQFWELDYAAIDFSEDMSLKAELIDPSRVVKADGISQAGSLNRVDQDYCKLNPNEEMDLEYTPSTSNDGACSYFFVSTGYYHNLKKYEGKPQVTALMKFKEPGAFDEFSRQKFGEVQTTLARISSK